LGKKKGNGAMKMERKMDNIISVNRRDHLCCKGEGRGWSKAATQSKRRVILYCFEKGKATVPYNTQRVMW